MAGRDVAWNSTVAIERCLSSHRTEGQSYLDLPKTTNYSLSWNCLVCRWARVLSHQINGRRNWFDIHWLLIHGGSGLELIFIVRWPVAVSSSVDEERVKWWAVMLLSSWIHRLCFGYITVGCVCWFRQWFLCELIVLISCWTHGWRCLTLLNHLASAKFFDKAVPLLLLRVLGILIRTR